MPGKLISLEAYPGVFDLTGYDQFVCNVLRAQGLDALSIEQFPRAQEVRNWAKTALSLSMVGPIQSVDWLEVFFGWCHSYLQLIRDISIELQEHHVVGLNLHEPFTRLNNCPEIIHDLVFKFSLQNTATPLVMAPDATFYFYSQRWAQGQLDNETAMRRFAGVEQPEFYQSRQHCINHASACKRYEHPPEHLPLNQFWSLDMEGNALVAFEEVRNLNEGLLEMWLLDEVVKVHPLHLQPLLRGLNKAKLDELMVLKYAPATAKTA